MASRVFLVPALTFHFFCYIIIFIRKAQNRRLYSTGSCWRNDRFCATSERNGADSLKLSMWMILNRLEYLDPEVHIRENSRRTLRSAHRAYATNCVHVYPSSRGEVICDGDGDTLILRDIDPLEALDIVQYVFDFYNDWNTNVRTLLTKGNYQKVIEQAWTVFHNPVMLFDANFRLLGVSYDDKSFVSPDDDTTSRDFLQRVQQDSLHLMNQSIREYIDRQVWNNFLDESPTIYRTADENGAEQVGAVCNIFCQNYLVGRLFVLERNRRLNPGDLQSMGVLAQLVRSSMEKSFNEIGAHPFYRILEGKTITSEAMDSLMSLYQWNREDTFRVFVISFPQGFEKIREIAALVRGQLTVLYPDCCVLDFEDETVGIVRSAQVRNRAPLSALESALGHSGLHIGMSLECQGVAGLPEMLRQARYASKFGKPVPPDEVVCRFYRCAIHAFLHSNWSTESKRVACHPGVLRLWDNSLKKNQVLFETLSAYMKEERSVSATAKHLYIHKNTLLYRLNQIYTFIPKAELERAYSRDYIRLSINFLESLIHMS